MAETSVKDVIFPVDGPGFALRQDGMSLDVIEFPGSRPKLATKTPITLQNNHVPKRPLVAPQKEPISYQKSYYANPVRRPRDLSLCVADIYKAQPALLENSGRHTDPLQPQYQFLGATQVRPVEPYKPRYGGNVPKFSFSFVLETRDIEGAAPKRMIPERNYVRHNTDCSDIEYASPNYFSRHVRSHVFPGQRRLPPEPPTLLREYRHSNPLDPAYKISQLPPQVRSQLTSSTETALPLTRLELGAIPGSKPRKLQWSNSEPLLSLVTEDIAGAKPQRFCGEVPVHLYAPRHAYSKPILNTLTHDIPGAQVGTLKQGLAGTRATNPLNPVYTLLDGTPSTRT
eukprot:g8140.t1